MKLRFISALCVAVIALAPWSDAAPVPVQRGMTLGLYHADPEHSYVTQIDEIADLGVDSVSLVVVWMQESVHSEAIDIVDGRTVPDDRLIETIRVAHGRGLRVFLFPIVLLRTAGEGEWRGRFAPEDTGVWFASYRSHLVRLARLAASEEVELLSIGSELSSLEHHTDQWRRTIGAVRSVFPGTLTYSANWDHLGVIEFWRDLDFVSLSAYFILAERPDAPQSWLDGAWVHHRDEILGWHSATVPEMPLVVAEVGYASQDGIAQHPWDYTQQSTVDLEEQRMCYTAFIRAWHGVGPLRGAYFYEWGRGEGGPDDRNYTPRGKPAEELIRAWFSRGEVPGRRGSGGMEVMVP
jgi:Glycoside Hydrolase Family 113